MGAIMSRLSGIVVTVLLSCAVSDAQWIKTSGPNGDSVACLLVKDAKIFAGSRKGGVFLSTNQGANWVRVVKGLTNLDVRALAVHDGSLFAGTRGGVFISSDDGSSWQPVNSGLGNDSVNTLSEARLPGYYSRITLFAGTQDGLFAYVDSSRSWVDRSGGLTVKIVTSGVSEGFSGIIVLRVGTGGGGDFVGDGMAGGVQAGLKGRIVTGLQFEYAGTDSGLFVHEFRDFSSWKAADSGLTNLGVTGLANDPRGKLFISTSDGVFRTTDHGISWSQFGVGLSGHRVAGAVETSGSILIAPTLDEGVFEMDTSLSERWYPSLPGLKYYEPSCLAGFGTDVFVGTHGNGILHSKAGSADWETRVYGLPSSDLLSLGALGTLLYAGTNGNGMYFSGDSGNSWHAVLLGPPADASVTAIAASGSTVFAAFGSHLLRSTDIGVNWTDISPDTTCKIESVTSHGSRVLVSACNSAAYASTDLGASWIRTIPYGGTAPGSCTAIVEDTLYYGYYEPGDRDDVAQIYLSYNNGARWDEISRLPPPRMGLRTRHDYALLRVGTEVFAGTSPSGVWKWKPSFKGWVQENSPSLTELNVSALFATDSLLYASAISDDSSSRGVWLRPLKEMMGILSFDKNSLQCGTITPGNTRSVSLSAINTGLDTLFIQSVQSTAPAFSVTPSNTLIPPLSSGKFLVTFSDSTLGKKSGDILFKHNGPGAPAVVAVRGSVGRLASAPQLLLPDSDALNQRLPVRLQWDSSAGAQLYHVQLSRSSIFDSLVHDDTVGTTTFSLGSLQNKTEYFWRVSGMNDAGEGPFSITWSFTTIVAKPLTPFVASPESNFINQHVTLVLKWHPSLDAEKYHLQLSEHVTFDTVLVDTFRLNDTSQAISGLRNRTKYFWHVKAANIADSSVYSGPWNFTTIVSLPLVPELTFPPDGATNLSIADSLVWAPSTDAETYHVQLARNPDFTSPDVDDSTITGTSRAVGGLVNDISYYWRVNAKNVAGTSSYSAARSFRTIVAIPAVPSLVFPPDNATSQEATVVLRWNPSSGATSSVVELDKGVTRVLLDTLFSDSLVISHLDVNTVYNWSVRSRNVAGTSLAATRQFKTLDYDSTFASQPQELDFASHPRAKDYKATEYKLFGLPGSENELMRTIISPTGTQGLDWDLLWDNGGPDSNHLVRYDGSDNRFRDSVGRGFWIINKGNFMVHQRPNRISAQLDWSFCAQIALHPGWNIITSPFQKTVSWKVVQAFNGGIGEHLWTFAGGFDKTQLLEPYKGYYFYNSAGRPILRIPLGNPPLPQLVQPVPAVWEVHIILTTGHEVDRTASFGVSPGSVSDPDHFDLHKPRAVGAIASVYFSRPSWNGDFTDFATDFRTEFDSISVWEILVQTRKNEQARLCFSGLESVPPWFKVLLIDQERGKYVDLRMDSAYAFGAVHELSRMRIAVGRDEFVGKELSGVVPREFSLGRNFPNPFNLSTTISVDVPYKHTIELNVYNVLGDLVKTIFQGTVEPGRYWYSWDSRDNYGEIVPSGVYFYRLRTENGRMFSGKMVLIK